MNYRDSIGLLAATKVSLHLRLDQLYVVLRDSGRKVSGGLVFESIHQLLNHQGQRESVVRLHSISVAGRTGNDCHHATSLHVLQAECIPILPLRVSCKLCEE